jgi:hypothetical protein
LSSNQFLALLPGPFTVIDGLRSVAVSINGP